MEKQLTFGVWGASLPRWSCINRSSKELPLFLSSKRYSRSLGLPKSQISSFWKMKLRSNWPYPSKSSRKNLSKTFWRVMTSIFLTFLKKYFKSTLPSDHQPSKYYHILSYKNSEAKLRRKIHCSPSKFCTRTHYYPLNNIGNFCLRNYPKNKNLKKNSMKITTSSLRHFLKWGTKLSSRK